jgi:nicotinamidase-related amidase
MNNKTALLVIDMQNDFVKKNAILEVKGIRNNIANFSEFINKMRDKGILIIYTIHIFDIKSNPIEAKLFPELCKDGLRDNTEGTEIFKDLKHLDKDIVIKKNRYDAFIGSELELILKKNGIENIIITGTMSNVCCESTARTAMMKDFNVLFCSDLTFTSNLSIHKNTLKNISTHFGKVMTSQEIFKLF